MSHVYLVQTYIGRTETGDVTALEDSIRNIAADYPAVPAWRCILALMLEETGRTEAARKLLDELAPNDFAALRRDFLYPAALAWLTRLVARQRDAERAKTLYALLEPFADRNIVVSLYAPGCLGSAQAYLGLLAATFGDRELAVRHLDAGVAANERMGARPFAARTQYWLARILGARNAPATPSGRRAHRVGARDGRGVRHVRPARGIAAAKSPPARDGRRRPRRRRAHRRHDRRDAPPRRRVLDRALRQRRVPAEGHEGPPLPADAAPVARPRGPRPRPVRRAGRAGRPDARQAAAGDAGSSSTVRRAPRTSSASRTSATSSRRPSASTTPPGRSGPGARSTSWARSWLGPWGSGAATGGPPPRPSGPA